MLFTKPISAAACGARVAILLDIVCSLSATWLVNGLTEMVIFEGLRHSIASSHL